MGYYLNSSQVLSLYESETKKPYFVDKTEMLRLLIPLAEEGNNHICITRPRRFGKSVMAAMVGAFFSKGFDSSEIFESLNISQMAVQQENNKYEYSQYMNQYNLIYINFIEAANESS
ncbi:MAG: AAA family ATPase, partial [Lachnospiraceae bacterium]|nr:AAA family ATPase [Lachnospiraceae bacterium]